MSEKTTKTTSAAASRRNFLKATTAVAGTAALGFPALSKASAKTTLRFQSTWPAKDIFHEFALDYAKKVNDMSGGELRIEVLPAGSVVPALQLIDAVHQGILDGGHGVTGYWYGKNPAYSLFGTGPSFGMDANQLMAWFNYGGGQALYDELHDKIMKMNVEGFLYGPMGQQPLGWFKKPVTKPEDLKGLKYRTIGLSADLFKELGAAVTIMAAGDIVPALDRGLLDAAEFNNPSSDRTLGFPDVTKTLMVQSLHQPLEMFEVIFNKTKYRGLPKELQNILQYSTQAASADMQWKSAHRYSQDLQEMQSKQGVKIYETPRSVLEAQLKAWDKVIANRSSDPFFARILASQKAFAQRVVGYQIKTTADPKIAYSHYFGKR